MNVAWVFLIVGLVLLNLWASVRVVSGRCTSGAQRFLRVAIVWVFPIIGAVVCMAFLVTDAEDQSGVPSRSEFKENAGASDASVNHLHTLCSSGGSGSEGGTGDGGD